MPHVSVGCNQHPNASSHANVLCGHANHTKALTNRPNVVQVCTLDVTVQSCIDPTIVWCRYRSNNPARVWNLVGITSCWVCNSWSSCSLSQQLVGPLCFLFCVLLLVTATPMWAVQPQTCVASRAMQQSRQELVGVQLTWVYSNMKL